MTENAPKTATSNVLGLVLAGGQSRRMGGQDKARIVLAGEPMVHRVAKRLRPQVSGLLINSNSAAGEFEALGAPVVADDIAGFQGPLAGLSAAMRFARDTGPHISHILSVSTDTPFVQRSLCEDLMARVSGRHGASVAASREEVHWVVGLWPVSAFETLEAALESGERKVQRVLETLSPHVVPFEDVRLGGVAVDPFFNVNTPEDLAEAEAILQRRGVPIIGVAGWKGAGKTTLTCRLIRAFSERGLRVGSIKHSHHAVVGQGAGTDTARHAAAGAERVAFVSPAAWGIEPEIVTEPEPPLSRIVPALGDVDLIIVEGMKQAAIPKIEVRSGVPSDQRPALSEAVVAIASDEAVSDAHVPVYRRDDVEGLVRFLLSEFGI